MEKNNNWGYATYGKKGTKRETHTHPLWNQHTLPMTECRKHNCEDPQDGVCTPSFIHLQFWSHSASSEGKESYREFLDKLWEGNQETWVGQSLASEQFLQVFWLGPRLAGPSCHDSGQVTQHNENHMVCISKCHNNCWQLLPQVRCRWYVKQVGGGGPGRKWQMIPCQLSGKWNYGDSPWVCKDLTRGEVWRKSWISPNLPSFHSLQAQTAHWGETLLCSKIHIIRRAVAACLVPPLNPTRSLPAGRKSPKKHMLWHKSWANTREDLDSEPDRKKWPLHPRTD